MGKGGDLQKVHDAGALVYCGVDVAKTSISQHATERYNSSVYKKANGFVARMLCGDAFTGELQTALAQLDLSGSVFDVVSMQFALHYSFYSEVVARSALKNVSQSLRPGGIFIGTTVDSNVLVKKLREHVGLAFGNSVYKIVFDEQYRNKTFDKQDGAFGIEYEFTLDDAVTQCKEWLVHKKELERVAYEESLKLIMWTNLHEYIVDLINSDESARSMLFSHLQDVTLDEDQWEAAGLYVAFAFRKMGDESSAPAKPEAPRKRPMTDELIINVPQVSEAGNETGT